MPGSRPKKQYKISEIDRNKFSGWGSGWFAWSPRSNHLIVSELIKSLINIKPLINHDNSFQGGGRGGLRGPRDRSRITVIIMILMIMYSNRVIITN